MGDFINSAPLFVVILLLVVGFALLVKGGKLKRSKEAGSAVHYYRINNCSNGNFPARNRSQRNRIPGEQQRISNQQCSRIKHF